MIPKVKDQTVSIPSLEEVKGIKKDNDIESIVSMYSSNCFDLLDTPKIPKSYLRFLSYALNVWSWWIY